MGLLQWPLEVQMCFIGTTDTGLLRESWHAARWDDSSGKWFWTTRSFADTGLSKLATDTSNMAPGSNM